MAHDIRRSEEPHGRLSEIAEAMLQTLDTLDGGLRAIVLLDDMHEKRGTAAMHGYESDRDAMLRILEHAEAIAQANGISFAVGTMPRKGHG